MERQQNDYDVIIIGAGIGGLVCGCYLAKAGLKTLIVEKNDKPGGYCTSFEKNGFKFDACAHTIGSLREDGYITKILRELEIDKRINFLRADPTNIIISNDYKINFSSDINETITEFQTNFPKEAKNIERFFNSLLNTKDLLFKPLINITFKDLLDTYFKDYKLKAILSLPVLGSSGLSSFRISAFTAVTIYREYILNGGYYPVGGMQRIPDVFLERFKEFRGDVLLSNLVTKIKIENNVVKGICIGDKSITSKYVVSNVDARQTFISLIGEEKVKNSFIVKLKKLKPSLSMFLVYLGTDGNINSVPTDSNMWVLQDYNINKMYNLAIKGELNNLDWFLFRLSSDKREILALVNMSFKNIKYWKNNKEKIRDVFIDKIKYFLIDLPQHIIFKDAATPYTLYKQTLNYKGAAFGWAGIPSQIMVPIFKQVANIRNLYLTGHWTTLVQGIPGVAYLGRNTANMILKEK